MKEHGGIKILICIFAAIFLIHQGYSAFYKPITTESAEYFETVDGLTVSGYIIRNEEAVISDNSGVLHFVTEDGTRVAKNGVIAKVYTNADASVTMSKIEEISAEIKSIEEMQNYNGLQAADLELINGKVTSALNDLISEYSSGNYSTAKENSANLIAAINRKQMITGEQTDLSGKLESLRAQLDSLNASLPSSTGSVIAQRAGYFVTGQDGFEKVLTSENLQNITPEFLEKLKAENLPQNSIGKIVSDDEWYIAAKMTINDSLKYKEGDELTVKTTIKANPYLPVTVKMINLSSDSDSAVVIFSCRVMSSQLAKMRTGRMTVIKNTYEGLKISKKALRVVDGETGVYVLSGISVKFVPVTVVYSTDDYIICKQEKTNDNVLRLYDEVVVKGKNLYDGKIVG